MTDHQSTPSIDGPRRKGGCLLGLLPPDVKIKDTGGHGRDKWEVEVVGCYWEGGATLGEAVARTLLAYWDGYDE